MVAVIDSPDFMFTGIKVQDLSKFQKTYYFIKGLLVGIIFSKTNKNFFCFLLNLSFPSKNKIHFRNNYYFKKILDKYIIHYPNKRIVRVIKDDFYHFNHLFESYCLDEIQFTDGDKILECGANIGELYFSFKQKSLDINYIAFEPDPEAYNCLAKNLLTAKNTTLYNIALSDVDKEKKLYIDGDGGNSSLEYFGKSKEVDVEAKTIDSFGQDNIKLMKIEAEGHEGEVLNGALETLKSTEYVTVDYGPEKGIEQNTTISIVVNTLYKNGFVFVSSSKHRQIGLFKNTKINNE